MVESGLTIAIPGTYSPSRQLSTMLQKS